MREITFSEALREALTEEMEADPRVLIMGEDLGEYGGVFAVTKGLLKKFGPMRVLDTPISEAGFVGCGLGAALAGQRPIVEIMFFDFTLVAADQILNQVAKARYMSGGKVTVPMVIRTQGGGYRGNAAQHSQNLETVFIHVPGMYVVAPSTPYDAKGLLKTAIRDENPIMFIEHKMLYGVKGPVPEEPYTLPLGRADVKREGDDVTLVTYSRVTGLCLDAAEKLVERGVDVEVIDLRSLHPLDLDSIVESVKKTGRLVVVHEAHQSLGMGAEIAARVQDAAFDYLDAPIVRLGGADVPIPYAAPLELAALPNVETIIAAVEESLEGRLDPVDTEGRATA